MSNSPGTALARLQLDFCLAVRPGATDVACTRLDQHKGHCCDEVAGESWDARGRDAVCDHDHSKEKGLAKS
jgi:hypothetical protein